MEKKTKKKNQRNTTESAARSKSRRIPDNADLNDFGLEPPKIYRDSQRMINQQKSAKGSSAENRRKSGGNPQPTNASKRKKESHKREKKNKLIKTVTAIVVGIFVIALATVIALTAFFKVTDFTVKGSKIYSKDEIVSHFTVKQGDRLFLTDMDKASKYLEQSLPYVYSVQVKRKIPGTVELTIKDATAAYSIKNEDKTYILLDDNFKVLENSAKKSTGTIISKSKILKAEPGMIIEFENEDIASCLKQLAECIKANNFKEITAIYSNSINDNYVVYDGRITFKLGDCQELEKKIYQGLAACEKLDRSSPNTKGEMNITGDKQIYFTEK